MTVAQRETDALIAAAPAGWRVTFNSQFQNLSHQGYTLHAVRPGATSNPHGMCGADLRHATEPSGESKWARMCGGCRISLRALIRREGATA